MLKYIEELQALNLPVGKYAIFGSGPLAIRDIRDSNDIDVIVTADVFANLKEKYPKSINQEKNSVNIGHIEIFNNWPNFSDQIDQLIQTAEIINDLPFVKLDYVVEWKTNSNRLKDQKDLNLLINYYRKLL